MADTLERHAPRSVKTPKNGACTVVSKTTFSAMWRHNPPRLQIDNVLLLMWSGQFLHVFGSATLNIVDALKAHFDPQQSELYCRARLQRRNQEQGETAGATIQH